MTENKVNELYFQDLLIEASNSHIKLNEAFTKLSVAQAVLSKALINNNEVAMKLSKAFREYPPPSYLRFEKP